MVNLIEHILIAQNVTNFYSRVACPEHEDEYLNYSSRNFHSHLGFNLVGTLNKCGRKFGRWYNMCYFEKIIRDHSDYIHDFMPFKDLPAIVYHDLGIEISNTQNLYL